MPRWSAWTVVVSVPLVLIALIAVAVAGHSSWGSVAALGFAISRYPMSVRTLRLRDPKVVVERDRCVLRHGTLRKPLTIERTELHSIVPVWLGGASWSVRPAGPVVPRRAVPLLGVPKGDQRPALVFVLRAERPVSGRSRPLRGVIVAVEDLDAAQRAFQPWGLLARLTPGAFDWLYPGSKAASPGPDPVYGT